MKEHFCFYFNPHLRIHCIDLRVRGRRRERHWSETNINWLPPIYALTRDRTHNLLVYMSMLQTTEPPSHGTSYNTVNCT